MINSRNVTQLSVSVLAVLSFTLPVGAQSITPQTKPDCAKVVCTTDGAELFQPEVTVTITPEATITQVCYPNSCSSSWVPHEIDENAVGNQPNVFVIPESDRK